MVHALEVREGRSVSCGWCKTSRRTPSMFPVRRREQETMSGKHRWVIVVVFAAGMAWVESAVVVYLRTLIGRLEPYQPNPLPVTSAGLGQTEIVREVATMVMLCTVGWLAGRSWRARLSYTMIAFGAWDILYYVFLAVIGPWPRSILDWDILFLIPLPWWGPVLAPMLIAALMIGGGALAARLDERDHQVWPGRPAWLLNFAGIALAMYVFLQDAIRVAERGEAAIRTVLPVSFNWPLFVVALALLAAPVVDGARQTRNVHQQLSQRQPIVGTAMHE